MKKVLSLFIAITFVLTFSTGFVASANAELVTAQIASEAAASNLAASAGGTYVAGAAAPAVTGTQVALPVLGQAGNVMGYVVAEQASLVSALNAAGMTQVAASVAAASAGTTAGLAVGAGVAAGTIATGAAIVAGTAALVIASTGGDDTTSSHATASHH